MNRFIQGILLVFLLSACGSSNETDASTEEIVENFEISGRIEGASLSKISLVAQSERGTFEIAKTTTDANGNYTLKGNTPGLGIYSLMVSDNSEYAIAIPLDIGDKVKISAKQNEFALNPQISGAKWAVPLLSYMKAFKKFSEKSEKINVLTDETAKIKAFDEARKPLILHVKNQILKAPGNPVNLMLVSELFPSQQLPLSAWDPSLLAVLNKMNFAYQKNYPNSPFTANLATQIKTIEAKFQQETQATSGTVTPPEILLPNTDGKSMSLRALKGKVVLIDFWASWCAPCRRENPNVVNLYAKYKAQGFEVFSVSLDEDPAAWKKAIAEDKLTWPNHVSELKGWKSGVAQQYGVQSIPFTILLNREGKMVATDLRGEALEQKLLEVLKK